MEGFMPVQEPNEQWHAVFYRKNRGPVSITYSIVFEPPEGKTPTVLLDNTTVELPGKWVDGDPAPMPDGRRLTVESSNGPAVILSESTPSSTQQAASSSRQLLKGGGGGGRTRRETAK